LAKGIVILGAGGHGKIVLDICLVSNLPVHGFIDGGKDAGEIIHGTPVLGGDELLQDTVFVEQVSFVVGVGDPRLHRKITEQVTQCGGLFETLQHPSATVSPRAKVGEGTVINAGAVINIDARIGRHCILNTRSSVDHDCVVEDSCQICPGATLAGGVHCEQRVYVGSGATVLPFVRIGTGSVIGSGVTVIKDVASDVTLIGSETRIVD
jgi:sugar O-acyltransferase (sialic acid O-acetyltransferase NeuD family)